MRSHLALVVVAALASAACTHHLQTASARPCRPRTSKGLGIIGMSLDRHADPTGTAQLYVDRVVPEGPAATAGIRPGDHILAIAGAPTGGMSVAEAARRLRGPTGASVSLRVASGGTPRSVTITRVAPSELWSRSAIAEPGASAPVRASDVAPAAVAVPPCRDE
jgi:C-terminal processing protease CtpA/Prc